MERKIKPDLSVSYDHGEYKIYSYRWLLINYVEKDQAVWHMITCTINWFSS